MVTLVSRQGCARVRADQAVHRITIITLFLKRGLDIRDHLSRREIVIAVDRLIVSVSAVVGIVAVGRVPIAIVPVVISAAEKDDPIVTAPPPAAVVAVATKIPTRLFVSERAGRVIVRPV